MTSLSPHAMGMVAGVLVFAATVATVVVLLFAGGSVDRLRKEMSGEGNSVVVVGVPRLTDEVLETVGKIDHSNALSVLEDLKFRGRLAPTKRSSGKAHIRLGRNEKNVFEAYSVEEGVAAGRLVASELRPEHLAVRIDFVWIDENYKPLKAGAPSIEHLVLLAALDSLFERGFRRIEFVVSVDDTPRRDLAKQLGFQLEGVMRKHMIVDERNRDSALYSILNTDWKYGPLKSSLCTTFKFLKDEKERTALKTQRPLASKQ